MPYKDKEDFRKADLRYRARNLEARKEAARQWKKDNREHYLLDQRRYNTSRREQEKEQRRRGKYAEPKGTPDSARKARS